MNKLICPYCNKQLQPTLRQSDEYWCENCDCQGTTIEWVGSKKLWQELIRTRKALDLTGNALERIINKCTKAKMTEINYGKVDGIESIARETIKQIIETKDNK